MDIWDIEQRISARFHALSKRELVIDKLRERATSCGDCDHWMKSMCCPQERTINGYQRGPSANTLACSAFQMSPSAAEYADSLRQELAKINALLNGTD